MFTHLLFKPFLSTKYVEHDGLLLVQLLLISLVEIRDGAKVAVDFEMEFDASVGLVCFKLEDFEIVLVLASGCFEKFFVFDDAVYGRSEERDEASRLWSMG